MPTGALVRALDLASDIRALGVVLVTDRTMPGGTRRKTAAELDGHPFEVVDGWNSMSPEANRRRLHAAMTLLVAAGRGPGRYPAPGNSS